MLKKLNNEIIIYTQSKHLVFIDSVMKNLSGIVTEDSEEKLNPITFKLPQGMLDIIEALVKNGVYSNRAELIREAIQDLITWGPEVTHFQEEK